MYMMPVYDRFNALETPALPLVDCTFVQVQYDNPLTCIIYTLSKPR